MIKSYFPQGDWADIDTSLRGRYRIDSIPVAALAISPRLGCLVSASQAVNSTMTVYSLDEALYGGVKPECWRFGAATRYFGVDFGFASVTSMAFTDGSRANELPLLVMASSTGDVHVVDVSKTFVVHVGYIPVMEHDRTVRKNHRLQVHTRGRTVAAGPVAIGEEGFRHVLFFEGYGRKWTKTRQVQVWEPWCIVSPSVGPFCLEPDCSLVVLRGGHKLVHVDLDGGRDGRDYGTLFDEYFGGCEPVQVVSCRDGWLVVDASSVRHLSRSTGTMTDVALNVSLRSNAALAYVPGALFVGTRNGLVAFTEPAIYRWRLSDMRKAWCLAVVRGVVRRVVASRKLKRARK